MATRAKTPVSHREYVKKKQTTTSSVVQDGRFAETFRFRFPMWSGFLPMRLLKNLADRVAGTLCLGTASVRARPSRKDSSSRRSMPFMAPVDSHREEAIEDCIEFINSSSISRSTSMAKHSP
ncbi:josephin-like protein [Pyrus ussuriensis x Pyrus communis]|uniref:Josephin-like protein n=1 Tax=Pyrus ussuriensis x Pyrus communis TaxID=2448454 RepID=A0A5N5GMF9_9ROSA|nr:josephin-like protein [Pyrus ussuriensis x Pyrus communis]